MTRLAIFVSVSIGVLWLTGSAEAQWRYTDDKGNSKTVTLKMDVPAQYRNHAVYAGDDRSDTPATRAPEAATAPAGEQKPLTLVPGAQWWQYPAGSPERAAARAAAEQKRDSAAAAEQDAAKRANDAARCQALVNRESEFGKCMSRQ
jgi:hypothetical protein